MKKILPEEPRINSDQELPQKIKKEDE